jgi:signal transduction histidine kinase
MTDRPPPPPPTESTLALAHALRTPLTSLALGLGLLDDGTLGPLTPAQREVVQVLNADVGRLSLLVDRALRTDRLGAYAGPVERVPVDLGDLARDAAAPVAPQARDKAVELRLSLPSGTVVIADPVKLGWVVATLLGNALRYSPPEGAIDVTLSAPAGHAELCIADQGPGVPPEVAARIFDRSFGRGLFLAREIVEAHGGAIHVRSEVGRGSTFTVALPIRVHGRAERGE